jgi:anthranilate synthase component 1
MMFPDKQTFLQMARPNALIPVYKEVLADLITPVAAYLKVAQGKPYSFLLESVEHADVLGQYSFISADPDIVIKAKGTHVTEIENGNVSEREVEKPLEVLRALLKRYQPVPVPGLPPFHGGAVGYIAYDYVRFLERLPDKNPDTLNLPDLYFMITGTVLIFDHINNTVKIVDNVWVQDNPEAQYERAQARIEAIYQLLQNPLPAPGQVAKSLPSGELRSNFTREDFCSAVRRAREYICAGDIFQVVLSQRFEREVSADPITLYRALRRINPSPYMLLLQFPGFALVGSSPEVMTQVKDGICRVRPIAGTRRRGKTPQEDYELEQELLSDEKERAEHIMLVDLGRNDLGRVSELGSVGPVPNKSMIIERYSHVMHIVSEVSGKLRKDCDAFDALAATFPMGTVSGAPKIRAMEIIDELENVRRGPYAGGCGYISFSGEMDTCILIRTMVVKDGKVYVQAGAGIVYDSDPEREYEETVNKAKALLRAVEFAENGLE